MLEKSRSAVFIHSTFALSPLNVFHSTPLDDMELGFGSRVGQGIQSIQSGIEETLAELDVIKQAWRERCNAMSGISRLPTEVLSIIFRLCAAETGKASANRMDRRPAGMCLLASRRTGRLQCLELCDFCVCTLVQSDDRTIKIGANHPHCFAFLLFTGQLVSAGYHV